MRTLLFSCIFYTNTLQWLKVFHIQYTFWNAIIHNDDKDNYLFILYSSRHWWALKIECKFYESMLIVKTIISSSLSSQQFLRPSGGWPTLKLFCLYIFLFLCGFFQSSCAPVSQKQYEKSGLTPLTTRELKRELQDKNVHLEAIDFNGVVLFKENGTLSATNHEGNNDTGSWSLPGENLICIKFKSWYFGDERCYRIIKNNNSVIFFSPNGALHYTATITAEPQAIETGKAAAPILQIHDTQTLDSRLETAKDRFVRLAKNCPGCNLRGVDLSNSRLNYANLAGADLSGADLTNTNLRQANLQGADLSNAKLVRTNLAGANLSSANLSHADCSGSNFTRANVSNATFKDTNLTGVHLENIQGKIK